MATATPPTERAAPVYDAPPTPGATDGATTEAVDAAEDGLAYDAPEPRLNVCIFGAPGAGKTYLAGTAEDDDRTAPVLYLDSESSGMTIDWRVERLRILPVTNENCEALLKDVLAKVQAGTAIFRPTGEKYRTVVVDTLTAIADRIMWGVVAGTSRTRKVENEAEGNDWAIYNNRLHALVSGFRDAGVHVIMTAHERAYDNNVGPAMQGAQAPQKAMAAFNTIARLYTEKVPSPTGKGVLLRRKMLLQPDAKYLAKDRSDRLGTMPRILESPTISDLLDRIEDGRRIAIEKARERREALRRA